MKSMIKLRGHHVSIFARCYIDYLIGISLESDNSFYFDPKCYHPDFYQREKNILQSILSNLSWQIEVVKELDTICMGNDEFGIFNCPNKETKCESFLSVDKFILNSYGLSPGIYPISQIIKGIMRYKNEKYIIERGFLTPLDEFRDYQLNP